VKAVLENADLVYVLNQGQLLASGTPAEVAADPVVRSEYLGSVLDLDETQDLEKAESLAEEADEVLAVQKEAAAAAKAVEAEVAAEQAAEQGSDENA
jgi:predicted nucleic acid-binding protein